MCLVYLLVEFLLGNALGWPAPAEQRLLGDEGEQGFQITPSQWDWISSVLTLGAAISW